MSNDKGGSGGGGESGPARRWDSLRSSTISRAVPLLAGYGLNVLTTPVVVASLGLAQFGVWALTGAFVQYGALLDLGVSRAVTRFTALHLAVGEREKADKVLSTAVALVLGIGLVLLLFALSIAGPLRTVLHIASAPRAELILGSSVLLLVFGQLFTIVTGAAYGRGFQVLPNIVFTICGVSTQIATTLAAVATRDLVVYALTTLVCNVLTVVSLAIVFHLRIFRLRLSWPSWAVLRGLVSFGLKGQSTLVAELLIFQFTKILVGIGAGPAATGAYELGSRLALGFRTLGALSTSALLAPLTLQFSQKGVNGVREEVARLATKVVSLSLLPPLGALAIAPHLLALWLGPYAELTLTVFTGLSLAFTANMYVGMLNVAAEAIGKPGLVARSTSLSAVLSISLGSLALIFFGADGLIFATTVALVIGSFFLVFLVQSRLESTAKEYFRATAGPLIGGVLVCLICRIATSGVSDTSRLDGLSVTIGGGAVFLAIYLALAIKMKWLPSSILRRTR